MLTTTTEVPESTVNGAQSSSSAAQQVLDLFGASYNQAEIERAVFGHAGGSAYNKVRAILKKEGRL